MTDNTETDDAPTDEQTPNPEQNTLVDTTGAGMASRAEQAASAGSGAGPDPDVAMSALQQGDDEEKPDPDDVEKLDASKHVYQRDEDGELIPETDVVKIDGEWSRIERVPATRGFLNRIQDQFGGRDDIDMEEMDDLMSDFYVDPDLGPQEWEDSSAEFYLALMWNMIETVMGDTDDSVMGDLMEAVQERQEEEGN